MSTSIQDGYNSHVYEAWANDPVGVCEECHAQHTGDERPPRGWTISITYLGAVHSLTPHLPTCSRTIEASRAAGLEQS